MRNVRNESSVHWLVENREIPERPSNNTTKRHDTSLVRPQPSRVSVSQSRRHDFFLRTHAHSLLSPRPRSRCDERRGCRFVVRLKPRVRQLVHAFVYTRVRSLGKHRTLPRDHHRVGLFPGRVRGVAPVVRPGTTAQRVPTRRELVLRTRVVRVRGRRENRE